jgi:hypothetical protein
MGIRPLTLACVMVPLPGNVLSACVWLPTFLKGHGRSATPEFAFLLGVAFATVYGGGIVATVLLVRGRLLAGVLCLFFSLTPFPVGIATSLCLGAILNLR